ncbi:MAG TPA: hypothetical protein VFX05_16180, partial [Casimicrobiaceae bacterium]|nr:hypothetical protein [Casimicrobiaceae bacterium]
MPDFPRADSPGPEPAAPGAQPTSLRATGEDRVAELAHRVIAANARLNGIALVTAVVLIGLGFWAYGGIKHSLQDIHTAGLQGMLEAQIKALRLWADDRKSDAASWARDEQVRRRVAELASVASRTAGDGAALWSAPARGELEKLLAP